MEDGIIILTSKYVVLTCANCSMHFAVPSHFENDRRVDHNTFYCPTGHLNYFPQKNDCEMLREELDLQKKITEEKEVQVEYLRRERDHIDRSRRAYKAHLAIKKKVIEDLRN